ncbi:hypothetical protein FHW36_101811 [Chitinophaga polysaccharea]|uniref:Uncharacterized protein n=1 Tax=Chitinophaga polysaccharea TaxID=1293035 RepID=A0A561Q3E8_9BACT|nr:hypothetical protein [Chitinophaga polysaccharea]TWF44885.1 hypothetical protein FHW36_101811 [Chitinophaga polysaccharea]
MQHQQEVSLLRLQIPIGLRHALQLLNSTNGNIDQAIHQFKAEMIAIVVEKAAIAAEMAAEHLIKCNYDIAKALASIEEERYTLPERILRSKKNDKEGALALLADNLEKEQQLPRNYWLLLDQLPALTPVQYTLAVVKEWWEYLDYEGFDHAIYFHLGIVASQLETALQLPEIAHCLRAARIRSDELIAHYKKKPVKEVSIHVVNVINADRWFLEQEAAFEAHRGLIVDRLYELVAANLASL